MLFRLSNPSLGSRFPAAPSPNPRCRPLSEIELRRTGQDTLEVNGNFQHQGAADQVLSASVVSPLERDFLGRTGRRICLKEALEIEIDFFHTFRSVNLAGIASLKASKMVSPRPQ